MGRIGFNSNNVSTMASESPDVTASEIDKLRATIFASAGHPRHRSLTTGDAQTNARQSKHGNDYQTKDTASHLDNEPGLASIGQDSEEIAHATDFTLESLKLLSPNAFKKLQAMTSQNDPASGTQLISQSFYESILRKERSTRPEIQEETSQRTYEEGDSGHVDITSSFVIGNEHGEDLADSDPIDFSPVQSQQQLTQFPESQRFKTPATVGKKRRYNGDVVDTPAPVRNPLAIQGQPTPDGMLGLSQAFAATQAASSPLSNGLPTGPRSDRPSPNIELQTRPTTAASSSPSLRPIVDLRRAVTEPASKYKPVKQSQAERERQERMAVSPDGLDPDTFDEEFDRQDSLISRRRRQKERKRETKQELKSLSSPILHAQDYAISSPSKVHMEDQNGGRGTQSLPPASPMDLDQLDDDESTPATASEEETEQEEDAKVDVKQSSQVTRADDEDKENDAILVPKTVLKRRFIVEHDITEVDASPSIRHTTDVSTLPTEGGPQSSEPFRIMDSQSSQTGTRLRNSGRGTISSASDIIDFVQRTSMPNSVHSATAKDTSIQPSSQHRASTTKTNMAWPEDEIAAEQLNASAVTSRVRDTVPETASEARAGILDNEDSRVHTGATSNQSTAKSVTEYDTAPTHVSAPAASQPLQTSSPIRTTPPGRKRRRMLEISAEPSPRKPRSELSFNAEAVLQLDEDQAAAMLLQSSPRGTPNSLGSMATTLNIPLPGSRDTRPANLLTSSPIASQRGGQMTQPQHSESSSSQEAQLTVDMSQEVVKPGRHTRQHRLPVIIENEVASRPENLSNVRQSIFDISASPEDRVGLGLIQKTIFGSKQVSKPKKGRGKARNVSRMEKRLQPDNKCKTYEIPSRGTKDNNLYEAENLANDDTTDTTSDEVIAPHMVLAYYKGDPRGYYPAEVLGRTNNDGYRIVWEGYEPEDIDAHGVKALDLRIGDAVKILAKGFMKVPYIIQGFKDKIASPQKGVTDIRGYQTLIVSQKQRKSLSVDIKGVFRQAIPVSVIYLDMNMWAQMNSRNQEFTPAELSISSTSAIDTPVLRGSTPATPSSRSRRQTFVADDPGSSRNGGIFTGMAFVVSYDDSTQKNMLTHSVQMNGGLVIQESFHDLLDLDTMELKSQYQNIGFTALLTERHSRKEKYMQALALGLPCISGKWIESSTKQNRLQDWLSYLLPAGESIELDNATRSRILPMFNADEARLSDMLQLRPNLLQHSPVIAVVGRGKAEQKRAPYLFLIQAIGASQIHKVPDMKSAKEFSDSDQGKTFKWIFVDDKDVEGMRSILESTEIVKKQASRPKKKNNTEVQPRCRVAGNELIVQSLILGKLCEPS